MKQLVSRAIVLGRIDYGEADRILTLLTPHHGKLRVMAKGVRRITSKLAGGIELFSVSEITYIQGRGEVGTLISSRLVRHYDHIMADVSHIMAGYECIKQLHAATQDEPDPEYFALLVQAFESLNNQHIALPVITFWFAAQLLRLEGRTPNLQTDKVGAKLDPNDRYEFDLSRMAFCQSPTGPFTAPHIKFLRISFADNLPQTLQQIAGIDALLVACAPLVRSLRDYHLM